MSRRKYLFPDFGRFVCEGDSQTIEHEGLTVTATVVHDYDSRPEDSDCYSAAKVAAWKRDEWHFCGIVLTVSKHGVELCDNVSLWGIERNYNVKANRYLREVADDLLPEAMEEAHKTLTKLQSIETGQQSAQVAIAPYLAGNANEEEALTDLLTDLRHWAHGLAVSYDRAHALSQDHYKAEHKTR